MSLMTKKSFRHWQELSMKPISEITRQHIAVAILLVIIIIVAAVPQIVQHPKKRE
jgi:hypothetical protein